MDYKKMKEVAKEHGINAIGKSIPQLTALLLEKGIDVSGDEPVQVAKGAKTAKPAPAAKDPVKKGSVAKIAKAIEGTDTEEDDTNPLPPAEKGTDKELHIVELSAFNVKQLTAAAVEMNKVMGLDPAIPLSKNVETLATDIHHEATAEELMPIDFGIGAKKNAPVFSKATATVLAAMSDVVKKLKPEIKALYPDLFPVEKTSKAGKAAKPAKAEKAAKAPKAPKEPKVKKPTRVEIVTRALLDNPDVTDEAELLEIIATAGEEHGIDRNDKEVKTYHIPRCKAVLAIAAEFYAK